MTADGTASPQRTVVLLGTLDTKRAEYAFVADRLHAAGLATVLVDVGVLGELDPAADVTREEVARAAGVAHAALARGGDRGAAVQAMATGAARVIRALHEQGRCDAAFAMGGTGGTSLAATAFRGLPIGVPKLVVSTAASGDTRPYVGETDLVLVPSVVDVAGVNRLSAEILANAAAAVAGMVTRAPVALAHADRPLVGASMFGVTTPCVGAARAHLEDLDYEVLVFHMTGMGGRSLESLAAQGRLAGVLDVTTTELADELVGGVFSAGPDRLTAAGAAGVPQVVSVGALDMVNFGPKESVPERFAQRNLLVHNASVTLMRTTPQECAEVGARMAERLSRARGPVTVMLPLRGVSAVSVAGGPFHDPAADAALFDALRAGLDPTRVELVELDAEINDPDFARAMAARLSDHIAHAHQHTEENSQDAENQPR
ncbi:Tm-1-like ATP-binding domain-containing protein [Pseudonocardia kunmingensis]|uniref:Uncharacterized protein (UPF0261 family) n=1 Tax=Pseudonocardia kunmingensis TaxID=630975 RepID=A0A543DQC9_9PSEU|nr:Tm-1-like ATP-binding domain-containing protein [Pseudonocardia kunmingensis]TQM11537.1 uncharacterized protein (UPF0261 family) [Pseudonocardia kunmingensis]